MPQQHEIQHLLRHLTNWVRILDIIEIPITPWVDILVTQIYHFLG